MTKRIAMWSGPRNISTAMMRSWENRMDTEVVDEPFYAYYLNQTGSPHPCFDEVIDSQSTEFNEVVRQLTAAPCEAPIQYQKHMTHHMLDGVDLAWTQSLRHCFLIRDPAQVVNSYTNSRGVCSVDDIGIIRQTQLYREIRRLCPHPVPIVDSNDVLKNPDKVIPQICQALEIDFTEAMLTWPQGRRESDGVWAKHWYANVEKSTGFGTPSDKPVTLNAEQQAVVDEVLPYYLELFEQRLQ